MLFALLGGRPLYADALGVVPTSYLPAGGLVDSLDTCVAEPSARCAIWRRDDFPLAGLVGEAVANPKLHREDLRVARCLRLVLLWGGRAGPARLDVPGDFTYTIAP